jgi:hypothetical protein
MAESRHVRRIACLAVAAAVPAVAKFAVLDPSGGVTRGSRRLDLSA